MKTNIIQRDVLLGEFGGSFKQKVFEFWHNDCIHESAPSCVSLHRTLRGAEIAMEFHKKQAEDDFKKLWKEEIEELGELFESVHGTYNDMEAWGITEREIEE